MVEVGYTVEEEGNFVGCGNVEDEGVLDEVGEGLECAVVLCSAVEFAVFERVWVVSYVECG
eukprot:CAMPEP_0197241258 /NCGR_PEP_ID=MMETSP1429-20130617/7342_1 /TAXON_ID=49237 /ORGANISM="Chaetoceros  sp., Strain UNC1202" /LENGTH=60 /DNA_ID=CAMNT_0042701067 /DNA_START=63 /DNA_END=245 /DNA_ORIENTATION=-